MTAEEIRDLCLSACKVYHNYLEKTGKGLNEVEVWSVETIDLYQRIISIRLSKKIFDAEALFFRFADDPKQYDGGHIEVLEYDTERNILYVQPKTADLFQKLNGIRATDLKVIADMKFLVQRVQNWFEQKGRGLQLPDKSSPLDRPSVSFANDQGIQPSADQLQAIRTIITKPFSYIWGAPGTGKTQLVLANVVIQYARQGKRCAIIAPTNTALEQVMKGVLRMSDAAGIPRNKFLRLGHTTKQFAEMYPEVCESHGIASQKLQIEKQMRVLKNVMRKEEDVKPNDVPLQLEEAAEKLKQVRNLMSLAVTKEKSTSQKLIKQLLKEAKEGMKKHPAAKAMADTLEIDTIDNNVSFLTGLVDKLRREDALLQAKTADFAIMPEAELKQMLDGLQDAHKRMNGSNERAKEATVIAATLDSYIHRFLEDDLEVEHIFLDEAGYANAIKAMVLMNGNVPVTFLGDHLQLPPVCEMNDMDLQDKEQQDAFVWSKSAIHLPRLFEESKDTAYQAYLNNEEALSKNMARADLRYTHRFGDNLANILNEYVYRNGFASDSGKGETEIFYVHVDTPVPQFRNAMQKPTRESEPEAVAIRQFIQMNGLTDYAVLTPYTNQVKLLAKMLTKERNEGRILTVHGAQGKEWDNVLISVVDTDKKWFTDTKFAKTRGLHLINTAVSRAKRRVIIFCNYPFWKKQNGQLIKGLLDVAEEWPMM